MQLPKTTQGIVAAVILIAIFAVIFPALQSCEKDIDLKSDYKDSESEVQSKQISEDKIQNNQNEKVLEMQESTDKLVVYMTIDNEKFLTPAINIFKEKYPDVEVEIVKFASEVITSGNSTLTTTPDEFRVRLNTELAAGKGPDLILADTRDFPDIYKTIKSGMFADLNN